MDYKIVIISGPSGSGKSTIIKFILEKMDCYFSISSTTRTIRKGEVDGKDYYFISKDEFLRGIENNQFLEYELVHSNYYGSSREHIENAIKNNKLVIFDIDTKGHNNVKKHYPNAKSIFLTTKSKDELKNRLLNRGLDNYDIIQERINNAKDELNRASFFDYIVINDDIDETKRAVLSIIESMEFINTADKLSQIVDNF